MFKKKLIKNKYEPVPQDEENDKTSTIYYHAELRFKGHTKQIVSLITSSDKEKHKKLISNSLDNTIRFWDLGTGNLLLNSNMGDLVDFPNFSTLFFGG